MKDIHGDTKNYPDNVWIRLFGEMEMKAKENKPYHIVTICLHETHIVLGFLGTHWYCLEKNPCDETCHEWVSFKALSLMTGWPTKPVSLDEYEREWFDPENTKCILPKDCRGQ